MRKTVLSLMVVTMLLGGVALAEVFHGGDIVYTEPVKAVLFSHAIHVEEMGMGCEMCHAGLFEMAAGAAEKNEDFTMQGLYDGKYCGSCHNGSFAFSSDTECALCHIGVKGYNRIFGAEQPASGGH